MKRLIPGRFETLVLFGLVAACLLVVQFSPHRDMALALCTAPLFLFCSLLGYWRHERLRLDSAVEEIEEEDVVAEPVE